MEEGKLEHNVLERSAELLVSVTIFGQFVQQSAEVRGLLSQAGLTAKPPVQELSRFPGQKDGPDCCQGLHHRDCRRRINDHAERC